MSFGFSVGDFLAAGTAIRNIIGALKGEATFEYRELELELHGLQRALSEIEHLRTESGQDEAALNAIKAAALMCQYPLDEFRSKLRRYQRLSSENAAPTTLNRVKGWGRKARWNLSMEEEVHKLRAYIAGHTASLNMRLLTLGISTLSTAKADAAQQSHLLREGLSEQSDAIRASTSRVGSLYELVATQALPRLDSLLDLVRKVWESNMKMVNYLSNLHTASLPLDTTRTFFQEPLRLEDAFGRILPIPAEYGWTTMQAVITERFSAGPGSEKILAGEYELFLTRDSSALLTEQTVTLLQPGSAITMAVVIGMYEAVPRDRCPRPGCASTKVSRHTAGGWFCETCMAWFAKSQTALPRPFRLLSPDHGVAEDSSSSAASSGRKRKERGVYGPPAATTLNRLRSDRMWFKNVRIHFTEWPWDLDVSPSEEKTLVRKRARVEEDSLGCRDVPEPSAPDFRGALQGQKGPTVSNHAGRGETEHDREVFVRSFVEALQVILRDLFMMDSKSELSDSTNLFELGMDSITAMCIISRLRQHGIVASVQMLLRNPVVGKLKELIERG